MDISAIILAAGQGKRLQKISQGKPKFLVQVKMKPLLAYPIKVLEKAGINNIVVVVPGGWINEAIQILQDISKYNVMVIENSRFWRENGYSLLLALRQLYGKSDIIVISMVDHLYTTRIVSKILSTIETSKDALFVVGGDSRALFIDHSEATKILADDNIVIDIGKKLVNYNYIDIGVMAIRPQVLGYIEELASKEEVLSMSTIIRTLGAEKKVKVADVTGCYWTEIDTEDDYYELFGGKRSLVLKKVLEEIGWD